ncbi:MAG: hypothetical protein DRJ01_15475 [Bacteroidetes bacterium]|nr:MAG: hypothetical protein DRJ01_15475 [Bacteroidota bacterium]
MKQLNKAGENLGGFLQIWAVPKGDCYVNLNNVTFSTTENIYQIYCSPESLKFTEQPKETDAKTYYNTDVTGFLPGNKEEVKDAISAMENRWYQVIVKDANENFILIGTAAYPLKINAVLQAGKNVADLSGYQINFSGKTITRAIFINNPF